MKKTKESKALEINRLKNPVAKFAFQFNKAQVFKDKTKYQRKMKHKGKEPFPILFFDIIRKGFCFFIFMLFSSFIASAADGMINVQSEFSVTTTVERLEKILHEKGMTIFNRISHSEGAAKIGIQLRETELIIFGNPKAGSPLMKCQQSIAIDLPQKALIWKDENNKVWISYNDMEYLIKRHDLQGCETLTLKIGKILASIINSVASGQ